jgi:hypothetical protein
VKVEIEPTTSFLVTKGEQSGVKIELDIEGV